MRYLPSYSLLGITTRKTIFSFSRRPEKKVFPKRLRWNMIFLVLSGKMIFLFPENMILRVRRKMKDDLSLKIHGNMIFSSGPLKIWPFQKVPRRHMVFLVLSGKLVFFPENMIFFLRAESERRPFPGNIWKHDALPSKKKKGYLIYRAEVWSLLKFILLEIFHNE